jgi:microcystin degradation protein MlrC
MRVGIVALQHESNTFLPTVTTLADFRRDALLTGEAIRAAYGGAHHEVGGFFAGLKEEGIEAVPLLLALATPSGVITAETVESLLNTIAEQLELAGPLDGLLVAPHGAGVSELERDLDGYWLTWLRERVGWNVPFVCTLDPHANVSSRMISACDATIAYRSNPHLDQRQVGEQAARLIARTLRGEVKPVQYQALAGVSISIDRQHTTAPPCTALYALADKILQTPGVLSNSVILNFPYADVAELGSSFIVVTDDNKPLAQQEAERLSKYLVEHRAEFACGLPGVEEALDQAAALDHPVCLLDVGDNVGGGSPGDGTTIANALHARRLAGSLVCLTDPAAAEAARAAGVGAKLELSVGGKGDPLQGPPLAAEFTVVSLHEGHFEEPQPRHGGRVAFDMGPTAVLQTGYGMTVLVMTERVPPFSLRQLTSVGLDPAKYHFVVAKGVNAPIAAYREVCPTMIRVNTPGVTCADMTKLEFQYRGKPLYPFEDVFE